MWYQNEKQLNLSKPIIAQKDGQMLFLTPIHDPGSYTIIGYDWLRIDTQDAGTYNSCCTFKTVQQAVSSYESMGYDINNASLTLLLEE